jgi:gluconate transporter
MGAIGLMVAIPVFLDVALIVLAPLVFAMAARASKPAMLFALPLLAGLAVGHALIPPTPGPIAVAEILGTDLGWMIGFGLLIGVVTMPIAGPIYAGWLDRKGWMPEGAPHHAAGEERPAPPVMNGATTAILILLPLVLIFAGTLATTLIPADVTGGLLLLRHALYLIGHPFVALLAACGLAMLFFRGASDAQRDKLKTGISRALEPTGAVILVTGAGGAFKQVLVDTGAGAQLANAALAIGMTPLIAGYALAVLIRLAQGSATVAMITAAGLVAPIASAAGLSAPELALVAIGVACGATALSHVNDSGFWLVNRLFGLTERETFQTWSMTATLVSVVGFICASVLMVLLKLAGI